MRKFESYHPSQTRHKRTIACDIFFKVSKKVSVSIKNLFQEFNGISEYKHFPNIRKTISMPKGVEKTIFRYTEEYTS